MQSNLGLDGQVLPEPTAASVQQAPSSRDRDEFRQRWQNDPWLVVLDLGYPLPLKDEHAPGEQV